MNRQTSTLLQIEDIQRKKNRKESEGAIGV
jgi:hypothetical protein